MFILDLAQSRGQCRKPCEGLTVADVRDPQQKWGKKGGKEAIFLGGMDGFQSLDQFFGYIFLLFPSILSKYKSMKFPKKDGTQIGMPRIFLFGNLT